MEDYDDSDQATGSPTAGESGFVHVESIDSPSVNSSSSSNQDDGVVVARVDTVQEEPSELKMTDDGGNEEFVDCPDDLVSYDGRTDMDENREDELVLEGQTTFGNDAGILSHLYQEERRQLMTELTSLRYQLKGLIKKHELIGVSDVGPFTDEITSTLPLHEMINDCSRFIELAVNEQSQTEGSLRDLYVNLDMKERTIEDLNMKVVEMSSVETVADRISSFVATVLGEEEFPETSVSGKLSHIEKNTSMIIQKYNRFLNQAEMLNQCLAQVKSDYHIQIDMEKVLFVAREELVSLKRKEFELVHKSRYLENEYGKLMQHLEKSKETIEMLNSETGKLKGEVEVHKTRFNNTKEKLNLAVTKGKSLVQQRDSLKEVIVEKTSELDKCLIDLQEKSSALEAANSLKESLLQRDMVLRKCEEILTSGEEGQSLDIVDRVTWLANERMEFQKVTDALSAIGLPEAAQHLDFESRVSWLLESLNVTKQESIKLQDEINTTKEAARAEVDRLTVSLLLETQEKNYLEEEFANLKDKNGFLQIDLQRSEEKGALLREKLSMAVKKGKGLVQERAEKNAQIEALKLELKQQEAVINEYMDQIRKCESLVQECAEKNAQIEALKLELKQQEATINDYRDQISKCEGLVQECAENNAQIEALKLELKQQEATINDNRDQTSKCEGLVQERAEKNAQIEALKLELKQQEATTNDCMNQISKLSLEVGRIEKLESDLLRSKEEREQIKQYLVESNTLLQRVVEATDAIVFSVDLSDPVEKVKWCVAYTNECQVAKSKLEQELGEVKDEASMLSNKLTDTLTTMKSLEDALSVSEKHVIQLTEESKELENLKINTEEKLQKVNEEVSMHAISLNEAYRTIKSLEDATSQLQTHISQFSSENEKAVDDRNILKDEIKKFKEEAAYNEHKFMDASATVKTLEDALLKAENTISNLVGEKKNAEQEISTLNVQLNACRQELAEKQDRVVTLEHDIKVLRSTCADVTKELKFIVEDNRMGIDSSHALGKLNYSVSTDVGPVDDVVVADIKVAEEMLCTARNVGSVIEHCVDVKQKMSTTIKDLQAELEETGSMYDKAKEENDMLQSRVYKLETELEASQNLHDEMSTKLDGYQAKEDEWDKREAELFMQSTAPMKDQDAENDLLSASEVNSIFSKINGITIPFPNIVAGVIEVHDSDPIKKIFYIIDSVNELLDHINSLSHSKEELQSTLSTQALEIEHLKDELEEAIKDRKDFENMKKELYELSIGFEHIIREFGGDESDGGNKSANVAGMLPVLESLIHNIYLDSEREKARAQDLGVKLSDTQKAAEELASKVKLLEDFNQNRTGLPDSIHERGGSEASSLPPRPEISEVENPGSVGKRATPLVRTLRKGSNDHLALNIDPESDRLIDNQEILEDKGHIFKSLHTSGLVPSQGKSIADWLDGIWVSSGRALMSRPQARLGLIAYWVVLHLWLLGTLL